MQCTFAHTLATPLGPTVYTKQIVNSVTHKIPGNDTEGPWQRVDNCSQHVQEWGQDGSNSVTKVRNYCAAPARTAFPALFSVTVPSLFNNNSSLYVVNMSAQRTRVWSSILLFNKPSDPLKLWLQHQDSLTQPVFDLYT